MTISAGDYLLSGCTELPTINSDKFVFRLELKEPSSELKEKARKDLRETPENVEKGKKELRDLLRGKYFTICI